jgi:hypothetical protein
MPTSSVFSPSLSSSSHSTSRAFSPVTTSGQSIHIVPFTESQQTATGQGNPPEPASPISSSPARAVNFESVDGVMAVVMVVGSWFVAFL